MAQRKYLEKSLKYFTVIFGLGVLYILIDFAVDLRPASVHSSYRFTLDDLRPDQARILRQDNLSILVIRRSTETIAQLEQPVVELQDPESLRSKQPGFAKHPLRSKYAEYFVSYAIGTDLGCPLAVLENRLTETCGNAAYDFAGRALRGDNEFQNLAIPDYNFSDEFNRLTFNP